MSMFELKKNIYIYKIIFCIISRFWQLSQPVARPFVRNFSQYGARWWPGDKCAQVIYTFHSYWSYQDTHRMIILLKICKIAVLNQSNPDSKIHGANMRPTWDLSAPDGPHDGPMNLAIREWTAEHHLGGLTRFWIPVVEIRWTYDHLIFTVGIPIQVLPTEIPL